MRYLLIAACLLAAMPVLAQEVFRWTDENGQVHYGRRPPATGGQRVELPPVQSSPSAIDRETMQRRDRQQRLLKAYEHEREQKKTNAARAEDERRAAAARCTELQGHWRRLSHSGPVYIRRADGGRDYLNDEQRAAEIARLRPAYQQACGREP